MKNRTHPSLQMPHFVTIRRVSRPWQATVISGLFVLNLILHAEEPPPPPRFIVIVNSYENPELARAFFAQTYENLGKMAAVGTRGQTAERVYSNDVKAVIKVPSLSGDFVASAHFDEAARCLDELTSAVESFPLLRGQFLPLGTELKTIVDSRAAGLVRRGGLWIPQTESNNEAQEMSPRVGPNDEVLATLTDLSGKTYKNVIVFRVDPNGLNIRHDGGVVKLSFLNLPEELRRKYDYDPQKAAAFSEEEQKSKQMLAALNDGRRIAAWGEVKVDMFIDPNCWGEFPDDPTLRYQFVQIRFYEIKETTTMISRQNALGGVGLSDSSFSRDKVHTDARIVSVIGTPKYLETIEAGIHDRKLFPVNWRNNNNFKPDYVPLIFTFEPELAARLIASSTEGKNITSFSKMEQIASGARVFSTEVFQNLGNGEHLLESLGDTMFYKVEGCDPSLAKGKHLRFIGYTEGEIFQYQNAFNVTRSVEVIKFLSSSVFH